MAPGDNITTIYGTQVSGTSFSAPFVSGTLALVQQKYPFLSARQLADTVLSTANHDFEVPDYVISTEVTGTSSKGTKLHRIVFRILNPNMKLPETTSEALPLVEAYINANRSVWNRIQIKFSLRTQYYRRSILSKILKQSNEHKWRAERVSFEEVFGQGLLDAGKAINGVARLDANRLKFSDSKRIATPGFLCIYDAALDTFDTKGHTAYFDNDITERRWSDHYHHKDFQTTGKYGDRARRLEDLPVGLHKVGAGTLGLRGHNTFTGPVVVSEGTLVLEPRKDGTGGMLETSVVVKKQGAFEGVGKVHDLHNSGLVKVNGVLEVNKFVQYATGTLHLAKPTSLRAQEAKVAGTLVLGSTEGKLTFAPSACGVVVGEFNQVKVIDATFDQLPPMLLSPVKTYFTTPNATTPAVPANVTQSSRWHNYISAALGQIAAALRDFIILHRNRKSFRTANQHH